MDDAEPASEQYIQEQAFREAQWAANASDPIRFLAALQQERVLDGLVRRLCSDWDRVSRHAVEDAVVQAVDELYAQVQKGHEITRVVGLLRWRADKRIYDHVHGREYKLVRGYAPKDLALVADLNGGQKDVYLFDEEEEDEEPDQRSSELFARARELVPRLGEDNIQKIMIYLLDALEAGRASVPNQEIADVVGLTLASAKSLKSRAIDRFLKRAPEVGLPGLYISKIKHKTEDKAQDDDAYWDRFGTETNQKGE